MKTRLFTSLFVIALLALLTHCTSRPATDADAAETAATFTHQIQCSHDDTLSLASADSMIKGWISLTAGLHINDMVAMGNQQIDSMVSADLQASTVRIYIGLSPTRDSDSTNLCLIMALVDSTCSIVEDDRFLLFEGLSGKGRVIDYQLASQLVSDFVRNVYALPQFSRLPRLQGFGFSRSYFQALVADDSAVTNAIGKFSVRNYRCEEVSADCDVDTSRVTGIDLLVSDWLADTGQGPGVNHVAVNFSVPCPRFCGAISLTAE